MFELFAKKAGKAYEDGDTTYNNDGSITVTPPTIVKIGGQEFVAGDPQSAKAFDSWVQAAKAKGTMISTGPDGAHYPLDSTMGKAELIKAELQIKHGASPEAAQKAVDQLPGLKPTPPKPAMIFKATPSKVTKMESSGGDPGSSEPVAQKSSAKAVFNRGPREVPVH